MRQQKQVSCWNLIVEYRFDIVSSHSARSMLTRQSSWCFRRIFAPASNIQRNCRPCLITLAAFHDRQVSSSNKASLEIGLTDWLRNIFLSTVFVITDSVMCYPFCPTKSLTSCKIDFDQLIGRNN